MAIFLSHESAIEMLCYLRTLMITAPEERADGRAVYYSGWCKACNKKLTSDAIYAKRQLSSLNEDARELLSNLSRPLHVLVPDSRHVTPRKSIHPHLWTGDVGRRAFIDLGNDVFLSMPSFVILQMAPRMTPIQLTMLAMMFCGYYAPGPSFCRGLHGLAPETPLTSLYKEMTCTSNVFEVDPICTQRTLKEFIERHPKVFGARAARTIIPWVRNSSASHMETALYLLLCLPKRLGGYGLPKPLLNPLVTVEMQSGKQRCYPDLYWNGSSIDMEYASDWAHTNPSSAYLDSRRMNAIVCNKISYLSITTEQLRNADDLDDSARGLAKMLNRRFREPKQGWIEARRALRAEVLPTGFEENSLKKKRRRAKGPA